MENEKVKNERKEQKKLDVITNEKLESYFKFASESLEIIKKNITKGKEKEACEVIEMVSSYLSDAKFFKNKGDYVNAFASLAYAYGWIDCAARLKIFNVNDKKRFSV